MPKTQYQNQIMPPPVASLLRELYLQREITELRNLIAACNAKGWTLTAIGNALGLSREYARILRNGSDPSQMEKWLDQVPEPPQFEPWYERREREAEAKRPPEIPSEVVSYLITEWKVVKRVNGKSSPEMKERSKNFTHLLQYLREQGHTVRQIADALNTHSRTIYFRLGRYGFHTLPPSQQHALVKDV